MCSTSYQGGAYKVCSFHQPSSCKDGDRFLHQSRGGGAQNRCKNLTIISYANISSCLPRNLKNHLAIYHPGQTSVGEQTRPSFPRVVYLEIERRHWGGEGQNREGLSLWNSDGLWVCELERAPAKHSQPCEQPGHFDHV